ncbi:unnamed protein product [Oikopleura dioica]|nr:unnamed protein product [Oikopleura dioica]
MQEMRRMFSQTRDENRSDCGMCSAKFDNDEHAESVPHCGHRACAKCLKGLDPKICPACRTKFTDSQIIRIY